MKPFILFATIAFTLLGDSIVHAQNTKFLAIDQLSIPLDAAVTTDSSAAGRMLYLATVEISLREGDNITMIQRLYNSLSGNRPLNLSVRTANINGSITEERFYQSANVDEILLPAPDAADKNVAKAQIKIRAASLSVKQNAGSVSSGIGKRSIALVASNFRVMLGGLPSGGVAKIDAIRIVANQPSVFNLEISEQDAAAWQNWLMTSASKRESGAIEWLAPDFKTVLLRIGLRDAEIISATTRYNAATDARAITRVNIGLRARVTLEK